MLNKNSSLLFAFFSNTFFFGLLAILFIQPTLAQNIPSPSKTSLSKKVVTADFLFHDVEYTEMAVISNVLKIINNNGKNYTFSINMSLPKGWKTLNKSNKEYDIAPGDTLFVPVRLVTSNKAAKGGTKYNVSAFISSKDGQIAAASFLAGHKKISNWQMNVLPRPRIYFLNGEDNASFQLNLSNNGDEEQDIIFSMTKIGRDFSVSDSTNKMLKKSFLEFRLLPFSDTLVPFVVKIQKPMRNERRIDTYDYIPNSFEGERHYSLFLKASEAGVKPGTGNYKSSKMDFVKLANNIDFVKLNNISKVNQAGASTIPLTMIANINNILGMQPIMNIVFYGNTQIDKKSQLDYYLQTGFTYYKYSKRTLTGANGYLGYHHEKFFVTSGNGVGLNLRNISSDVNGHGITAGYHITPKQSVGVYFVRTGRSFTNYQSNAFGTAYSATFDKIQVGLGVGRNNFINGNSSNSIKASVTSPIGKYQSININGRIVILDFLGVTTNTKLLGISYSAHYLKEKANSSLSFSYSDGYSGFGSGVLAYSNLKNINIGAVNSYKLKKDFRLTLLDNYYLYQMPGLFGTLQNNFIITNYLNFELPQKSKVTYIPAIYCNYSNYYLEKLLSSGVQIGINTSNLDEYFRVGVFLKGGYNKLLNFPQYGTFFNGQSNLSLGYHTWTMNLRYSYGPQGQANMAQMLRNSSRYPQSFLSTLGNQYQFENKHFIWENTFNYNYINTNQTHNLGLYSQFFYFTNSGWQFNINISYNYNISPNYTYSYSPGSVNNVNVEETGKKTKSQSFQLGLGVKKDFSIPIPKKFRKTRFCHGNIKAFLDINGNKIYDPVDVPLDNIVIRMNDNEVLTNTKGEATFLNMNFGKYKLQVISLTDIGAWFPVVTDSIDISGQPVIYIPFSKGVQILGSVVVNREKFSGELNEKLDVSRIKIFLVDSAGKSTTSITDNLGDFKFYVPYGNYTLIFDEKILGSNFELTQNDVPIILTDGIESFYHTFYVIEKKRKVTSKKFNADGSIAGADSLKKENAPPVTKKKSKKPLPKAKNVLPNKDSIQKVKLQQIKAKKDSVQNWKLQKIQAKKDSVESAKFLKDSLQKESQRLLNKIEQENNEEMTNMHEMDSLVDALLTKPDSTKLSDADIAKVEAWWIKKSHLSNYKEKEIFVLQVGAFKGALPLDILVKFLKTGEKMESFVDQQDGLTKYFIGNYSTYEEATIAKKEMREKGLPGAFVIGIYKGDVITADELNKIKKGK